MTIANKATSGGSSNTIRIGRTYGSSTITVSGHVPTNRGTSSAQITVKSPELYAGAVLRSELAKLGVQIAGKTIIATTPATWRHVARHRHVDEAVVDAEAVPQVLQQHASPRR